MDIKAIRKDMEARQENAKKEGFEKWINQASTRALISMIPASENKDLVRLVLQDAYDSGFGTGAVVTTVELLQIAMRKP